MKEKEILIYDIALLPDGMSTKEILEIIKQERIAIYDSRKNEKASIPKIINKEE